LVSTHEQDENGAHDQPYAGSAPRVTRERIESMSVRNASIVDRIRLTPSANRDVHCRDPTYRREQLEARELSQAALESVPIDGRVLMTRHDDSDARKSERGSENPHVEVHGPNSLPLSNDGL
jgi:hypothetical protein